MRMGSKETKGKDNQVRGAKVRAITKGKVVRLNRPALMLYQIEVSESPPELPQNLPGKGEGKRSVQKRDIPHRAAALDAAWKIREMSNQSNDQ